MKDELDQSFSLASARLSAANNMKIFFGFFLKAHPGLL